MPSHQLPCSFVGGVRGSSRDNVWITLSVTEKNIHSNLMEHCSPLGLAIKVTIVFHKKYNQNNHIIISLISNRIGKVYQCRAWCAKYDSQSINSDSNTKKISKKGPIVQPVLAFRGKRGFKAVPSEPFHAFHKSSTLMNWSSPWKLLCLALGSW